MTQPVEAAGRLLLYEVRDGALHLLALDPRSGKTLWEHPATDSGITGGVAFNVTVQEDTAYYLRETQGGFAQVVAVDVRNGSETWATAQAALRFDDLLIWASREGVRAARSAED